MSESVQERYAPNSACFGCGPKNDKGLRIKSRKEGDALVATFMPEAHHEAFPNVLAGGIVGTLLDCHSNWTAAIAIMEKQGLEAPPCCVTAEYAVKLKRPTPTGAPVELRARVVELSEDRARVDAELVAQGKVCATCTGTFIAVKPGHPAYNRW